MGQEFGGGSVPVGVLAEAPAAPAQRYLLQSPLGKGAMGEVWRAWDRWLERQVAVKVPEGPPGSVSDRLLRAEALVTAGLDHPAVVGVLDVATAEDGRTLFVTRLAPGVSLQRWLSAEPRPGVAAGVRVIRQAAGAAAHAHQRGVVHRDLSPHNVLVGDHGEVAVIDWGVAARVGDRQAPERVGTPGFWSPEQAQGAPPDPRADVWSLGAMLREVVGPSGPLELEAIVARAQAEAPGDRYPDGAGLEADLVAWEEGRLVGAYRYGAWDRLGRWLWTFRVPVAGVGLGLVVLSLQAARYTVATRASEQRALEAEAEAREALAAAKAEQALAAWRAGDERDARRLADEALQAGPSTLARGVRMAVPTVFEVEPRGVAPLGDCPRWRLPGRGPLVVCLREDRAEGRVGDRSWEVPGAYVDAWVDDEGLWLLDSLRLAHRIDPQSGEEIGLDGRSGERVSPEGDRADLEGRALLDPSGPPNPCGGRLVAFVGDGAGGGWFGCGDGAVFATPAGAPAVRLRAPSSPAVDLLFVSEGQPWMVLHDGAVLPAGEAAARLHLGEPPARALAAPGTPWVAVVGRSGRARLLDAAGRRWALELGPQTVDVALGPGGELLRVGDGALWTEGLPARVPRRRWQMPHGVDALAWSLDNETLWVGDGDGALYELSLGGGAVAAPLRWQDRVVKVVDVGPDGQRVASAMGGALRWAPGSGVPEDLGVVVRSALAFPDGAVWALPFNPGLLRLGPGTRDVLLPEVKIEQMSSDSGRTGLVLATRQGIYRVGPEGPSLVDPSPAALADHQGPLEVSSLGAELRWRRGSEALRRTFEAEIVELQALSDGRVAVGLIDGTLWVLDPLGQPWAQLPAHSDRVGVLAPSPDGSLLASAGWDGLVLVLDPVGGAPEDLPR